MYYYYYYYVFKKKKLFYYTALNHKLASTKTGIYIELVRRFFRKDPANANVLNSVWSWLFTVDWINKHFKKNLLNRGLGEQHSIGQHQLKNRC